MKMSMEEKLKLAKNYLSKEDLERCLEESSETRSLSVNN